MSPAAAVGRSTCLVTVNVIGADDTFSASRTRALTAESKRLVAVTVTVSLTPAEPAPGIATWTSKDAPPPDGNGTGAVSTESPPSRTPLPFTSRYTVTGQLWIDAAATVKESGPFPRLVITCGNTIVAPGLPLPTAGGWRSTCATCVTTRST